MHHKETNKNIAWYSKYLVEKKGGPHAVHGFLMACTLQLCTRTYDLTDDASFNLELYRNTLSSNWL